MKKSGNLFKTTLRLNLDNAQDLEAWNNLMSADTRQPEYSSYSRTIVTAINDHFARHDHPELPFHETDLLRKIEATIRDAVADSLKAIPLMTSVMAQSSPMPAVNSEENVENEAAIEAFLDSF